MNRRAVVTGIGVVTPAGIKLDNFWENIISGKSFTSAYTDFPDYKFQSRVCGRVGDNFKPEDFGLSDADKARMGRHTQFAYACAKSALEDANMDLSSVDSNRMGVCIANAIADTPYSEKQYLELKNSNWDTEKYVDPHLYSKAMFSCVSTDLAKKFNCQGNAFTMSTGCTGGIDAIGYAYESILNDEVDIMICGASEAPLSAMTFSSFDVINAISKNWNQYPDRASRPFDKDRDGFVVGEGAAVLILEEYKSAKARNANIYGEILSYATNNNAFHMTDLPDDGLALRYAIKNSIDYASDVTVNDIDYINAHGSSTPQNDICEAAAFADLFGEKVFDIPISSTKSIVGHPLAAASAIEIVVCFFTIKNNQIHPTINLENPDPRCLGLDYVAKKRRAKEIKTVLTDASGFSGLHSSMIMREV